MNNTMVGVDLATEMTPSDFHEWLTNSQSRTVVFEACGTSNYWKQQANKYGHDSRLISARLVDTVRQNQKNAIGHRKWCGCAPERIDKEKNGTSI